MYFIISFPHLGRKFEKHVTVDDNDDADESIPVCISCRLGLGVMVRDILPLLKHIGFSRSPLIKSYLYFKSKYYKWNTKFLEILKKDYPR